MREFRLIEKAIDNFGLDLKNIKVLTEAASGNFIWTSLIAALAGAHVFAYSKDSKYASFRDVENNTKRIAKKLGVRNNLNIISELNKNVINCSDIITNTGFLRPLDYEKLQYCKKGVVIPLMYEAWEFRTLDIDREYCKKNNIPILGTNESDHRLETFKYLGVVAKKALLLNNIEVFKSKIVILGFGTFADAIYDSLKTEVDFIEIWNTKEMIKDFSMIDAFIIADHQTETEYVGINGLINPEDIKRLNQNLIIIHISGNINVDIIQENFIKIYPRSVANFKCMSLTTDFVGPKPIIDLHTAGLKVGELYLRNYLNNGDFDTAIQKCSKEELIQIL